MAGEAGGALLYRWGLEQLRGAAGMCLQVSTYATSRPRDSGGSCTRW